MTEGLDKTPRPGIGPGRAPGPGRPAEPPGSANAEKRRMPRALERIDGLLVRAFGIQNLPQRGWHLESRVSQRARQLGLQKIEDYASFLEGPAGREELARLFELIRIGQTTWMRHAQYLDLLTQDDMLANSPELSVWSAGCGTGQEVYSVAMLLLEAGRSNFQILGTDLSRRAVELAARGFYDAHASEGLEESLQRKYWIRHGGGIEAGVKLRRSCSFSVHNLVSDPLPMAQDAILCRNVLMYFEPRVAKQVLDRLVSALRPGGLLVLGPSELGRVAAERLEPIRKGGGLIWRKESGRASSRTRAQSFQRGPAGRGRAPAAPSGEEERKPGDLVPPQHLSLEGAFPVERIPELESILSQHLSGGTSVLRIDLDGATFLCDEAARVILRAARHMEAFGGSVTILATRLGVRRWIRRCGLGPLAETPDRRETP